eukprot:SAG11_NODE_35858_length_264_cov_1.254545_1_plen_62_part_01
MPKVAGKISFDVHLKRGNEAAKALVKKLQKEIPLKQAQLAEFEGMHRKQMEAEGELAQFLIL